MFITILRLTDFRYFTRFYCKNKMSSNDSNNSDSAKILTIANRARSTISSIIPGVSASGEVTPVTLTVEQVKKATAAMEWLSAQFNTMQDTIDSQCRAAESHATAAVKIAGTVTGLATTNGTLLTHNLSTGKKSETLLTESFELKRENDLLKAELVKLSCPWGKTCDKTCDKTYDAHRLLKHDHNPFGPGKPRSRS
jgi:hypothetical protein